MKPPCGRPARRTEHHAGGRRYDTGIQEGKARTRDRGVPQNGGALWRRGQCAGLRLPLHAAGRRDALGPDDRPRRQQGHARALLTLAGARRARGRRRGRGRDGHPLPGLLPQQGPARRGAGASARDRFWRRGARKHGGAHEPARRRPQDGQHRAQQGLRHRGGHRRGHPCVPHRDPPGLHPGPLPRRGRGRPARPHPTGALERGERDLDSPGPRNLPLPAAQMRRLSPGRPLSQRRQP